MILDNFQSELENIGKIYKWNPTALQLKMIAKRIAANRQLMESELHVIISEECPTTIVGLFEGVDNSDLRTLIALAISVTMEDK
ncbi:MAG: hypothetical protein WCG53_02310 [Actinomycetes bacterium]